jgi:hypothetical protein
MTSYGELFDSTVIVLYGALKVLSGSRILFKLTNSSMDVFFNNFSMVSIYILFEMI